MEEQLKKCLTICDPDFLMADVTKVICPPLYSKTMTEESDADILPNDIL